MTTMQYTQLGRTGLKVSRLVLGTMNFGPRTTPDDSFTIMDSALDQGINFFDTANVYGGADRRGWTEEIVGDWFERSGQRDKVVLATKVYGDMTPWPNHGKVSAYSIRKNVDDSLRRLKTDRIDLYQMHHIDRATPWEELWQAMDTLVAQGKVLYVGSSNFAGWNIAAACESARARNSLGLVSEQSLYHLGARTIELEVLPASRHYGLGVIPWSPLGGGLLGGVLKGVDEGRRTEQSMLDRIEKQRDQLERWEAFCEARGEQPADVALAWLLAQPGVTGPIIGPRTLEQLEAPLRALDITLDEAALAELDEIWPGPGGQAPEAYAW